jgi:hypothetical protein
VPAIAVRFLAERWISGGVWWVLGVPRRFVACNTEIDDSWAMGLPANQRRLCVAH